ncbi:NAD-dependent epimerase/dehydratase family protein [Ancylobacter amanitiformis]|uniref:Nucleoside-diphosphate-sugar epimerase n=1 Tax=Ancylobacter amanitiformis TaxID=217069 RepID=A0ABU0LQR1_9HYPH|nr:NAD-dependent epimerase/dehydratase family protein [Ancylobacter amanitiformis]MDQ0510990.1 nucleoside-diphosphate-sugar epimerase [Ancylobacter amanitiformis]
MTTLLCLGFGYCARHFAARRAGAFARITGTGRNDAQQDGVEMIRFDGAASPALLEAARAADIVLASAAPLEAGDPFLPSLGAALAAGAGKGPLIYLSTIGVYGDTGGGWIDESAPTDAAAPRARRRIEAEAAWRALGQAAGRPVAVLRLGGIYGPGRNALADLAAGTARCIEREGQVFNRIHVDDIAGAIGAVIDAGFDGILNVVDGEPSPSCAPVAFAARLMGLPEPQPMPFEQAAASLSPMALSFWADNRRVRNDRLIALTGPLAHPSYREGLAALFAAGEGGGQGSRPSGGRAP